MQHFVYFYLSEEILKIKKQPKSKLLTRRSFYFLCGLFFIDSFFLKFDLANAKSSRIKKAELLSKFDLKQCRLSSKESSNKKYVSLTLIMHMNNANEVIDRYMEVSKIDGIISL